MTPRTRSLLGATLATLVLSGCSASPEAGPGPTSSPSASASPSSSGSPSPSQAAPVVPAAPKRSACYRLTPAQLTKPTNASSPVPCSGRHTAQTVYVGTLDTVVDGHAVAVDSATVQKQLMETCPRKLDAYVGGSARTRDLSRFNVVWFSPTLEQSDQGADWFRCDVIAFAGRDRLVSLPGPRKLDGVLDSADGPRRVRAVRHVEPRREGVRTGGLRPTALLARGGHDRTVRRREVPRRHRGPQGRQQRLQGPGAVRARTTP